MALACEKQPKRNCRHCYGTGFFGILLGAADISKDIQVNAPCPCGSKDTAGKQKKFKKCCKKIFLNLSPKGSSVIPCSCIGKYKQL